VANIFYGQPTEAFTNRLNGDEITDLKCFERFPALILIVALMVIGIFPRLFSDNADSELSRIPSYSSKSILPVIEVNAALPQTVEAHKEVIH